jgi:putative FmdB family regulatory protein
LPNYRYSCQNCGLEKEEYLPITQRNKVQACPTCGTSMVKLVGTGMTFNLKGNGFYHTGWQ